MKLSIMYIYPILLWGLVVFSTAYGNEITISGQNEARYARGEQPESSADESYGYLENYLELNTNIDKFRIYLRQSYKIPSEFGYKNFGLNAIDKRYIEYRDKHISIRGGDFYRSWGSGLLFGNVEFLELNLDTGLEGILIESSRNNFDISAFRGVESDSTSEFREAAEGAYISYLIPHNFIPYKIRLGGSLSRLDEGVRHPQINRHGFEIEGEFGVLNLYTAYVSDKLDSLNSGWKKYHNGFYSTATVYGVGWGLLFEYKNYELFTYNDPGNVGGVTDYPSLQYPATGVPEATIYLMDRHPRLAHYYDDLGIQIEGTASYEDWGFSVNYNMSSEHDGQSLLPKLEEEFSPYRAFFAHIEHHPWNGNRMVFQGSYSENIEFTHTVNEGGYSLWFQRIGLGGIYEYKIDNRYSLEIDLQLMQESDKSPGRGDVHWEEYIAISLSRSPNLVGTFVVERTEDNSEVGANDWSDGWLGFIGGGGLYWPSAEVVVDFYERHQMRLFYGYERGGLRCTGGVCRVVNPFKGAKIIFTSYF